MRMPEVLDSARDAITVKRVFAEPVEKDGLTIIPVASVAGGGGGGSGKDQKGQDAEGGGFGVSGRPAGAYVIKDGAVTWRPAVDPNRIVAVAGMVAVAYLLTRHKMAWVRAHGRSRRAAR